MRIGIVTQPLTTNYGGILQNYALQQVLKAMGHEVWTIDYGKFNWYDWYNNALRVVIKKVLGRDAKFIPTPTVRKKLETPLRRFVYDYISLTKPRTKKIDPDIIDKYIFDAIVVGSDQVWRPIYNYNVLDCFLKFTGTRRLKKIAYSASFGTDVWEFSSEQTKDCAKLAKDFKAVSVRELSGVELCKDYLNIDAVNVLDPTLLLHKDNYLKLCRSIATRDSFVFAYILDENEEIKDAVRSFAKQKGLPCIIKNAGVQISQDDSVELWLSFFRDASYVVTDSFHGTVFSIIFNKEFFVLGNGQRGNSRFESLLSILGLDERMRTEFNNSVSNIDWSLINAKREKLILDSMRWLKHALQ